MRGENMPVDAAAQTYASTEEMRETYGATRARLMGPREKPADKPCALKPDVPVSPLAGYPAVLDIVDAICGEIGLSREGLLTDIRSDLAVEARKIAAALVVRRLPITRAAAAEHFGILEESIAAALQRIDLTLVARAIPRGADLDETVRLIVADWQIHHELHPSIPDIKRAVCAEFAITRTEMDSARREAHLVAPRHFAIALTRRLTGRSLPFIGRHFGNRDHTTVLHAVRKMQGVIDTVAERLPEAATVEDWVRAGRQAIEAQAKQATARSSAPA